MKWLPVLLMMACALVPAQPRPAAKKAAPAPAATKWPIQTLSVDGNRLYATDKVLAVAGLRIGQMAGKEEFEAARDRLVATGFFEIVGYRFEPGPGKTGYSASFQVTEVQPVYPVRVEDLGVPPAGVEAMLHQRSPLFDPSGLPPTKEVLERFTGYIQEYLAGQGITEKMAGRVVADAPGQFVIVFRPARNLPAVAEVDFQGSHVLAATLLRNAMAGVAVGLPYQEAAFRQLLDSQIRPLYEARGRVRVAFPEVRTEATKDVEGLRVFVTVDEGESYALGKVEIQGPAPVSPDALLKTGDIQPGDVANFDRVREGVARMQAALRRAGYLDAQLAVERDIDDAKKSIHLVLRVTAGPLFQMGKLAIAGLDLNAEAEMRRIWTLRNGQPFNPDYPQHFLDTVREQGLFDNLGETKAAVERHDQDHTADVTLTFKVAPPQPEHKDNPGPPLP